MSIKAVVKAELWVPGRAFQIPHRLACVPKQISWVITGLSLKYAAVEERDGVMWTHGERLKWKPHSNLSPKAKQIHGFCRVWIQVRLTSTDQCPGFPHCLRSKQLSAASEQKLIWYSSPNLPNGVLQWQNWRHCCPYTPSTSPMTHLNVTKFQSHSETTTTNVLTEHVIIKWNNGGISRSQTAWNKMWRALDQRTPAWAM